MGVLIPTGDSVFRHVVWPFAFSKKAFNQGKAFALHNEADGSLLTSVGWSRYLPTETRIHAYGCRLAAGMNTKLNAAGTVNPKDVRIYCGAYELSEIHVSELKYTDGLDEIISSELKHNIEGGEIAHSDLKIVIREDVTDVEATKTAIIDRLWNKCRGPMPHVCECDRDRANPGGALLPEPPSGLFVDGRPKWKRIRAIVVCHVLEWFWMLKTQILGTN